MAVMNTASLGTPAATCIPNLKASWLCASNSAADSARPTTSSTTSTVSGHEFAPGSGSEDPAGVVVGAAVLDCPEVVFDEGWAWGWRPLLIRGAGSMCTTSCIRGGRPLQLNVSLELVIMAARVYVATRGHRRRGPEAPEGRRGRVVVVDGLGSCFVVDAGRHDACVPVARVEHRRLRAAALGAFPLAVDQVPIQRHAHCRRVRGPVGGVVEALHALVEAVGALAPPTRVHQHLRAELSLARGLQVRCARGDINPALALPPVANLAVLEARHQGPEYVPACPERHANPFEEGGGIQRAR
eukprot:CAMPEP_0180342030 /NCGR_PEP_ID=MMETSP0989-20121125/1529_1 /TAXON_ID=697907 /ORGANISM="non described non described, Strain CCMP2293" /LENGTH=298 /DNA_ID=CAMNT_0022330881 /DNA_START=196 /DNA_END=1094 /DNA_ORIENTATION=-